MKRNFILVVLLIIITLLFALSCRKDIGKIDLSDKGYPQEIGEIIVKKCATSGCHDDISKEAAGGLSLTSWEKMFEGSRGGAVVIPFRPDYSTLIYYTNSYSEFGTLQLSPKMPLRSEALTHEEVKTLHDWILDGASNADGFVKFSDNPNRKKFYVSNQGCDLITTFDAATMLAMRATNVGKINGYVESPHFVKISPDNKFWYVSFLGAGVFQKYKVSDNSFVAEANIGAGSWNTFILSSDGKFAYLVDWSSSGKVKKVQTDSMIVKAAIGGLNWSHGSAINQTNDTLYITSQMSNYIFKIATDFSDLQQIVLDNSGIPLNSSILDPHEVLMSPDFSKYFVTCQKSNEIKVVNRATSQVISTIPVGDTPQEMAIASSKNYLFVSCMEDITTFGATKRGSVYVIDINSHVVLAKIYTGHQPHGLMVDDQHGRVYVTNRNVISGGPAPHHASLCNGKNGYVTAIDLKTLKLVPGFKAEVSVDPYGYSITH
ncbi:MAG: YncE family protein [Bacteroidota bacterium]|nr:YncE family protein [Bacteroidota bacterium]